MGRKGKSWTRIKAISVVIDGEKVLIELDQQEKVKDQNDLFKLKIMPTLQNTDALNLSGQNGDISLNQNADIITDDMNFLNVEDSFFDSELFMNSPFENELLGNFLFDSNHDFILDDINE
mgnify:CR=1 FL=1